MFTQVWKSLTAGVAGIGIAALLSGCGSGSGGSNNNNSNNNNPVPTVASLSPSASTAGSAAQTVTITGTNFIATSTATFNSVAHTPTFVSATQLTISLTATDQAAAGSYGVVVTNPAPGGGSSTAVNFAVNNPVPTVTSISPSSAVAGAAAQTVTVTGTGFVSSTTATFNGTAITPTIVSATSLTIQLTAANQATVGAYPIVVTNPAPGGGSSAAVNFTVNNPAPTVASISPSSAVAGAAAQTVTVTGTNFLSSSTATFNGTAITPTIVSSTSLTLALTVADQASVGTYPIEVTNPSPGGGTSTAVNFAVTGPVVSGTVYKGASVGSTVTAYEVNANGSDGTAIGSATTDSKGDFSIALTVLPPGAVRFTSTGGSYTSEFNGSTVTGTSNVSALFDKVTASISGVSITPASEFVDSYTTGLLIAGTVTSESAAHAKASAMMLGYLGISSKDVIELLIPVFDKADITANPDAFTLGMFIGALATEGNAVVPTSPDDLIAALSLDISDGSFNGLAGTTPVPLSGAVPPAIRMRQAKNAKPAASGSGTLSTTAGTTDMLLAVGTYITTGSSPAANSITVAEVMSLENAFFGGVSLCTCTPSSTGLLAFSSGASTTYSLDGHQYLIEAARQEGVVVVDITNPEIANPPINAWPSISSTVFSGQDVGGVIAITGLSGHPQVLSYAYSSKTISVLNLDTLITGNPATDNPVDLTTTLTLTAPSPVGFSGGDAFIAGGIPDIGRGGIWLDTADGYGLLLLSSLTSGATSVPLSTLYTVQDPSEAIAENVGGDIGNSQLLGGDYNGIDLTELGKGQSYYLPSSSITSILTGFDPYGRFIDGNSVDGNYRVGILTSEDENVAGFLNLAAVTETNSTGTGVLNALAPGAGGLVQVILGTSGGYGDGGPVLSGSAVDPGSHLALFMAGYSTDIAVGLLQNPATVAAGSSWTGLSDWSYFTLNNSPELADYYYATDPHSVGVVVNQTTKTPFGYLFDGSTDRGIVQIDLTNFLNMTRAGTTGDAAHQPKGDPGATITSGGGKVIQEFTWTDPTTPLFAKKKTQADVPRQPMGPDFKK